jgi:hypothetical protein
MEQIAETLFLGVVANGLYQVVPYLVDKSKRKLLNKKILNDNSELKTLIGESIERNVEKIESGKQFEISNLQLFFDAPEVEDLIRQIYYANLPESEVNIGLNSIKEKFSIIFSLYYPSLKNPKQISDAIFDILVEGCNYSLKIAIDKGILSAHEANSNFRFQLLSDQLNSIEKSLAFLKMKKMATISQIIDFEAKYRAQIADRHQNLHIPHFDRSPIIPINELYVNPNFILDQNKIEHPQKYIEISDFLINMHRAVLLGYPGGGKSTLAQNICFNLANSYSDRILAGRKITPILVILRDYGLKKKDSNFSILEFIEATAKTTYQINPPKGAFEYLLQNGHSLVIFDGLDELLDTHYRQEIRSDIESFCNLYPSVPVLITSRVIGYDQSPLNKDKFEIFHLAPFNDNQVKEYANKWFAADDELTSDQKTQKAEAFLKESEIVPDIRSNPLMLALICNIYRGENYIPKNRAEVYHKCSTMLFSRWDKTRGISSSSAFEDYLEPMVQYLAYWIYTNENLQSGVSEHELIQQATKYLNEWFFTKRFVAQREARAFIDFCKGRAWILTAVGSTTEDVELFWFTHRTFLEYFTAAYIVSTNNTPKKILTYLTPKIRKSEWDVVAQLSFHIQSRQTRGATDELLLGLLDKAAKTKGAPRYNLLSFAARCLTFMIPKPETTQKVVQNCLTGSIDWGIEVRKDPKYNSRVFWNRSKDISKLLLQPFFNVAELNRDPISNCLKEWIKRKICYGSDEESELAIEISLFFSWINLTLSQTNIHKSASHPYDALYNTVIKEILAKNPDRISTICSKYYGISIQEIYKGRLTIDQFIKWHGIQKIFEGYQFTIPTNIGLTSIGRVILLFIFSDNRKISETAFDIKHLGNFFENNPPPWIARLPKGELDNHQSSWIEQKKTKKAINLSSKEMFGLIAINAIFIELMDIKKTSSNYINALKNSENETVLKIRKIFTGRLENRFDDDMKRDIDSLGLSEKQKQLLIKWAKNEINFTY